MPEALPTKSAFMPGSDGSMSTHQARKSAQAAYEEYVDGGRRAAIGTWGVSVGECLAEDLEPMFDGLLPHPHLPTGEVLPETHVSVWFPAKTDEVTRSRLTRQHERTAKNLLKYALDRPCLFRPPSESTAV